MDAGRSIFDLIVAGEAPEEVRAAVAAGTVPVPLQAAARVLTTLLEDPSEAVAEAARALAAGLPATSAQEIARDRRAGEALLHQLAVGHAADPLVTALVLNHPSVGPGTIQYLVYKGTPDTLRLIATLTPKLRANPHLIQVLLKHHGLPEESREQLVFLAESLAHREAAAEEPVAETVDEREVEEVGRASVPAEMHDEMTAEGEVDSATKSGWFERILGMKVSEKIYWAMKGNKEVRMNLVRDANKMVSLSVMKSPRITLAEVEMISNSTNVSVDVLRSIANNREWVAKYPVQSNLARNPKTPSGITLRFLPRLQKRDLQQIVSSKGIAEVVRSTAARLLKGKS